MGIPVVATNHFMTENLTAFIGSDKWKKRISRLLWKKFSKAYNRVALVTTPSEWAAGLIRPKLKTRVQTVSSGIDIDSFTPAGSGDWVREKFDIPDKPVLLFVGRLDPEKKIEETIRAVAVALSRIDFCFVIVGKGIKKTFLEKQVKELGIQDHVIFTGFVTDIELPYLYRLSNCFIISSTAELLSLGALQGMAAGLPVIAVNAGALSELIQPGENGFLYSSGDISALAGQICDILGNKLLAKKMSEKSSAAALKHEISSTVLSFEKIYLELAEPAVQSHKISIKPLKYKMA
jgi:glycosyltransferase involved in cell wall biosynthesis